MPGGEQKPEDQNKDKQTAEEPKDEETKNDDAKVKALTGDLGLKARSVKTSKGHIKVRLLADENAGCDGRIAGYGLYGQVPLLPFDKESRSLSLCSDEKNGFLHEYKRKKGVKYFYKVQLRVYDENVEN